MVPLGVDERAAQRVRLTDRGHDAEKALPAGIVVLLFKTEKRVGGRWQKSVGFVAVVGIVEAVEETADGIHLFVQDAAGFLCPSGKRANLQNAVNRLLAFVSKYGVERCEAGRACRGYAAAALLGMACA